MSEWEQRYRTGDTPWEKGHAAPPLSELLERFGVGIFGDGPVWVPGCGLGHDVRLLAGEGLEVIGLDLAPTALETARALSVSGNATFEHGDFLDPMTVADKRATALWEHTCFCAIEPERRSDYARSAASLLEPGGMLIGVFFLTPFDPGESQQGPPHGASREEIDACFAPWFERVDAWVPERVYPGREGREWLAVYKRITSG